MKKEALKVILVCAMSIIFYACGSSDGTGGNPPPAPPAPPSGPAPSWQQVAVVLQANCAKCHNGSTVFAFTEATFKQTKAKDELTSSSMPPPPNQISAADKALLLAYLGS